MQLISVEELQRHSTPKDCWLAVHGLVYDVTTFLPDHPGGSEIVEVLGGQDASADFEDALHTATAREEPKIELKGMLAGWEQKVEEYRKNGWTEAKGIPDVATLGSGSSFSLGTGLGIAVAFGAVGAVAAAWFAMRARKA
mmetsp:Transcript_101663/g.270400  ORF Transcript_101663/g.270400 Transcript_101663/m.270400 type:complete len:140 (-) Transcript_101663:41-460(-)